MTENISSAPLERLRDAISTWHPDWKIKPLDCGYAFRVGDAHGVLQRVVRLWQSSPSAPVFIKYAISSRLENSMVETRFDGALERLQKRLDEELARLPELSLRKPARRRRTPRVASLQDAVPRGPLVDVANLKLRFETIGNAVEREKPFLYCWEIFDETGVLRGVYVGKAGERKNGTPFDRVSRYRYRVDSLMAGKPYSLEDPDGYRPVHHALAQAVVRNDRVVLTLLANAIDSATLNAQEHQLIAQKQSYGPEPHQLNELP